jgi:hypothetical protein
MPTKVVKNKDPSDVSSQPVKELEEPAASEYAVRPQESIGNQMDAAVAHSDAPTSKQTSTDYIPTVP